MIIYGEGKTVRGTFVAKKNNVQHYINKYGCLSISEEALNSLTKRHKTVKIYDRSTGTAFCTSIENFKKHGKVEDKGWGSHCFLPIEYFDMTWKHKELE